MTRPTQFGPPRPVGVSTGGDPGLPDGQPPVDCCDDDPANQPDRASDVFAFFGATAGTGALVQSKEATFNGTFPALTYDTDPTAGGLLIAVLAQRGGGAPTAPTGWTEVEHVSGSFGNLTAWWRVAAGGPVTCTVPGVTNETRFRVMEFDGGTSLLDTARVEDQTWPGPGGAGTGTFTVGNVVVAAPAVLVGAVIAGDPGGGGHTDYTEDADFTNVDEGSVNSGLTPESIVAYRAVAAGTYDYSPTGVTTAGGHPNWSGLLGAFSLASAWIAGGTEATDGDDATYQTVIGPNVLRLDLGAPFEIARTRIRIATETSGARTYTIRAGNAPDFSDAVTIVTIPFTATGSFTAQDVTASWLPTDAYQYWELTGDAETRRIHAWELFEVPGAADGPAELGYAEITTTVSTTSTSLVDAAGLSVTVTIRDRPVMVEFWAHTLRTSDTTDTRAQVSIRDVTASNAEISQGTTAAPFGQGNCIHVMRRYAPATGSRTFKVQYRTVAAGTVDLMASATAPAFIRVYEI